MTDDNPEGLSHMQKAEALMASMWGVEVVKLDCREVKDLAAGDLRAGKQRWRVREDGGLEAELKALKP